jgi:deferrochelatase/peroxidase EfeB
MVIRRVGRAIAKPTIFKDLVGFAIALPAPYNSYHFDLCITVRALAQGTSSHIIKLYWFSYNW